MQYVTATEAKQTLGSILDQVQREPVIIRRQNRDVAVLISPRDYERLTRLNLQEFQAFRTEVSRKAQARGLTTQELDEVLASPA
ncbi:MAG: type II toxin-antitoxin system Phd/YefM family antitoxin [Synechococcaceae cyanobacterium SM2_3_2]|nr:type II toxin-antitoxin system Phd/YefM family antitoxin [Synechococcaceae cyanobacterium SM2_3_2]